MRLWRKRKPSIPPFQPPDNAELRRRAAEEDAVCALFGPDAKRVEKCFERRYGTYYKVEYLDGSVGEWFEMRRVRDLQMRPIQ
jgi:hypothetical protein